MTKGLCRNSCLMIGRLGFNPRNVISFVVRTSDLGTSGTSISIDSSTTFLVKGGTTKHNYGVHHLQATYQLIQIYSPLLSNCLNVMETECHLSKLSLICRQCFRNNHSTHLNYSNMNYWKHSLLCYHKCYHHHCKLWFINYHFLLFFSHVFCLI